ncbi:hypothetical protein PIB30_018461 [Stylosanthes scabra]|uniref:F-box domain-containing protein n=1 Tax=Stylosanthes scabra TaxID=79078 RepID=A0ABU6V850_9FABA|nr:hypothetical protein [Stylosanthes scabra]
MGGLPIHYCDWAAKNPTASKQPRRRRQKRNWCRILPDDITWMIISKFSAFEILTSIQYVCQRWRRICMDPVMWRTIYMCDIRIFKSVEYDLDLLCRDAIDRSCGLLEDITIQFFGADNLLKFIIDSGCHKLRRLRLVQCYYGVSDKGLCEIAQKLPLLEEVDITLCEHVSSVALEGVGRSCPLLKSFKYIENYGSNNEEAFAIAQNMPNLRHLQLVDNNLDNSGLSAILDGCPLLESLHLRGCDFVNLEGELRRRCDEQLKDLKDPSYVPLYDYQFRGPLYDSSDWYFFLVSEFREQLENRPPKIAVEIGEKEKCYDEEAGWKEIYGIRENIKNQRLCKGLIQGSSGRKKNNAKCKREKKHGRKASKIHNRKIISY